MLQKALSYHFGQLIELNWREAYMFKQAFVKVGADTLFTIFLTLNTSLVLSHSWDT